SAGDAAHLEDDARDGRALLDERLRSFEPAEGREGFVRLQAAPDGAPDRLAAVRDGALDLHVEALAQVDERATELLRVLDRGELRAVPHGEVHHDLVRA